MGEGLAVWYKNNSEYVLGALFGLVILDVFLFLMHCLIERTVDGYGLTTLVISVGFLLIAYFEKLYSEKEVH